MIECQQNFNCGGVCVTPEQVAARLCAACQETIDMVQQRTDAITEAATELLDILDAAANVEEPHSAQREWMERLRAALAA